MGGFELTLGEDIVGRYGEGSFLGSIAMGEFSEDLICSASYWSREDYVAQWLKALRNACAGASKSAIIASMRDPGEMNFVFVWSLYRDGEQVHVQNRMIFTSEIDGTFDPDCVESYIDDRRTISDDGGRISEWTVRTSDIQEFLARERLLKSSIAEHMDSFLFGSGITLTDYFLEVTPVSEALCFTNRGGREFYLPINDDELAQAAIQRLKYLGVRIVTVE